MTFYLISPVMPQNFYVGLFLACLFVDRDLFSFWRLYHVVFASCLLTSFPCLAKYAFMGETNIRLLLTR